MPPSVSTDASATNRRDHALDGENPKHDEPPQQQQCEGKTPDTHDSSLDGKEPHHNGLKTVDPCDSFACDEEEVAYPPQYIPSFLKDPSNQTKIVNHHNTQSQAQGCIESVNTVYRDNLKYLIIAEMLFAGEEDDEEEDDEDPYSPDYNLNESYIDDTTSPEQYLCRNFPQWYEDAQKCCGRPYCWYLTEPDCVEPPQFPYSSEHSPRPSMYFPYGRSL